MKKRVKSLHRLKEALGNYLHIEGNYLDHTSEFVEAPPLWLVSGEGLHSKLALLCREWPTGKKRTQ